MILLRISTKQKIAKVKLDNLKTKNSNDCKNKKNSVRKKRIHKIGL